MSIKSKKKLLNKILSFSGLFFFALAAYMIYLQLSKYTFVEIIDAVIEVPNQNIVLAMVASFCGYMALSSYDYLALKYIKRKIATWKWIFAGFIGFAVSNNAGHAIISGGAVRYRLYSKWRVAMPNIVKMITFSGFTYLVACFFLVIVGYIFSPEHVLSSVASKYINLSVVGLSVIGLIVYLGGCLFYKKDIVIKDISFEIPSFKLALQQIVIGSVDILMASLVLYFILRGYVDIAFAPFIGAYIIAQVLGVYSQVPGGLGVFEAVFASLLPDDANKAALFAALILYRLIYYLLPLVVSGVVLFLYEFEFFGSKRIKNAKNVKK